jgi:hypothetical protein
MQKEEKDILADYVARERQRKRNATVIGLIRIFKEKHIDLNEENAKFLIANNGYKINESIYNEKMVQRIELIPKGVQ